MLKRVLLALMLVGALAACGTPAATTGPTGVDTPTLAPIESPSDGGGLESPAESMEPSESPSSS